jgi:ferredoxin
LSGSLAGLSAAAQLAAQGYGVTLLSNLDAHSLKSQSPEYQAAAADLLKQLPERGGEMLPWPESLHLSGTPGRYEALIKTGSVSRNIPAGCIILDIANVPVNDLGFLSENDLLARVIRRLHGDYRDPSGANILTYPYSIRDTAAMLFIQPVGQNGPLEQVAGGQAAAARALAILSQELAPARGSAVQINRPLCRGCGDCSAVCSLITLKPLSEGQCYAEVDPALCLGCGMCTAVCPTGAIRQPAQTDAGIEAALEAALSEEKAQ